MGGEMVWNMHWGLGSRDWSRVFWHTNHLSFLPISEGGACVFRYCWSWGECSVRGSMKCSVGLDIREGFVGYSVQWMVMVVGQPASSSAHFSQWLNNITLYKSTTLLLPILLFKKLYWILLLIILQLHEDLVVFPTLPLSENPTPANTVHASAKDQWSCSHLWGRITHFLCVSAPTT